MHHSRQRMAQVVATRLDMMLRSQRVLTVKVDDDGSDGGNTVAGFMTDCSTRIRRSCASVLSLRSDMASRTNAVTIAVNKAALIEIKARNTGSDKANLRKGGYCSCSFSTSLSLSGPSHTRLSRTYTIWTGIERRSYLVVG